MEGTFVLIVLLAWSCHVGISSGSWSAVPRTCSSSDPQYMPHATDCQKFYQCAPGHAPVEQTCAANLLWSITINNCDYAHNVPCPRTPVTPTVVLPNETHGEDDNLSHKTHGEDDNLSNETLGKDDNLSNDTNGEDDNLSNETNGDYNNLSNETLGEDDNQLVRAVDKNYEAKNWTSWSSSNQMEKKQRKNENKESKRNKAKKNGKTKNKKNKGKKKREKKPTKNHIDNSKEEGNSFEGDMILNKEQLELLKGSDKSNSTRNAFTFGNYKWPNGIVYYSIDYSVISKDSRFFSYSKFVRSTLANLQRQLSGCIRFQERYYGDRVNVVSRPNGGCSSPVGHWGGVQNLELGGNLNHGCWEAGTIEHEFLHAIGIFHEQSRSDRHKYVTILSYNIEPGMEERNFPSYSENKISHFGLPYNYRSVMHYGKDDFGIKDSNGQRKITIETKDPTYQDVIGQRDGVSEGDIQLIRRFYGCGDNPNKKCLTSPGFPNKYPNNSHKKQTLAVDGQDIEITWSHFDVEEHSTCKWDYVEFFDGNGNAIFKKFCGNTSPPTLRIPTSTASVVFHSDSSVRETGFKFCYETGVPVKDLSSPNYPRNYPDNQDTRQTMSVQNGAAIRVTFHDFQLENHSSCGYDYVQFCDDKGNCGKKMCGRTRPNDFTIPTSKATVLFHSDYSVNEGGFLLSYRATNA